MPPFLFLRWLLLRFIRHVVITVLGLTSFLVLFDLIANASKVSAESDSALLALLFYALFRGPSIFSFILPFGVLIGAVWTCASLAANREIFALQAAGFTLRRIALILAAMAGVLSLFQFVLVDRIVTEMTGALNEWKNDEFRGLPSTESTGEAPEWLASGEHFLHMQAVSPDGTRLEFPTVIEVDGKGVAARYWNAETATHRESGWVLKDVSGRDIGREINEQHPQLAVPILMPPDFFSSFNRPVEELGFSQLLALGWGGIETQIHPERYYRVWAHFRWAQPLAAVVMVLLAAPLCLEVQRGDRRTLVATAILLAGFLYFLFQSFLLAMGETGALPPLPAAWGAVACFGAAGVVLSLLRKC